jgi:hypothetical protein
VPMILPIQKQVLARNSGTMANGLMRVDFCTSIIFNVCG